MTTRSNSTAPVAVAADIDLPDAMPARLRRARYLKVDFARHAARARGEDLSQHRLAAALEVQQPLANRWEQTHEPHSPSVLHVASGPRNWAEGITRWLATQHRFQLTEQARDVHGSNHAARLAAVSVECTDVPRVLALAMADGHLSDDELEQLAREARECSAAALELEAHAVNELQRRRSERQPK